MPADIFRKILEYSVRLNPEGEDRTAATDAELANVNSVDSRKRIPIDEPFSFNSEAQEFTLNEMMPDPPGKYRTGAGLTKKRRGRRRIPVAPPHAIAEDIYSKLSIKDLN
jgi:hypothetical protein